MTVEFGARGRPARYAQVALGVDATPALIAAEIDPARAGVDAEVFAEFDATYWRVAEVAGVLTWRYAGGGVGSLASATWGKYVVSSDPAMPAPYSTFAAAQAAMIADGAVNPTMIMLAGTYPEAIAIATPMTVIGLALEATSDPQTSVPNWSRGVNLTGAVSVTAGAGERVALANLRVTGGFTLAGAAAFLFAAEGCTFAPAAAGHAVNNLNTAATLSLKFSRCSLVGNAGHGFASLANGCVARFTLCYVNGVAATFEAIRTTGASLFVDGGVIRRGIRELSTGTAALTMGAQVSGNEFPAVRIDGVSVSTTTSVVNADASVQFSANGVGVPVFQGTTLRLNLYGARVTQFQAATAVVSVTTSLVPEPTTSLSDANWTAAEPLAGAGAHALFGRTGYYQLASGGVASTATLPAILTAPPGTEITVVNANAAGSCTVTSPDGTIAGAATNVIAPWVTRTYYRLSTLAADGTTWWAAY